MEEFGETQAEYQLTLSTRKSIVVIIKTQASVEHKIQNTMHTQVTKQG